MDEQVPAAHWFRQELSLVFANGRIVETGTYSQLAQAGGVFAELLMRAEHASSPTPAPDQDGFASDGDRTEPALSAT
jgi:hypothetical protein